MTTNTAGLPERIADVARLRDAGLFDASRALSLLLSAGDHTRAAQEFLGVILDTSASPEVERYRRALTDYREHPDELWLDGARHERP